MSDIANGGGGFNRLPAVRAYRQAGWRYLHPIIPPWAAPELGGKCPGVLDGRGAWRKVGVQGEGFYGELEDAGRALSHEARRAWGQGGAGIGVSGRWFPAIDVDVLDELAAGALRGMLREVFGAGCFLRVGRWPKFLMPFRLADGVTGVRKKTWEVEGGAIELLGWGQQWVLEGTHGGTGEPYRWLGFEEGVSGTGRPVVSRMPVLGLEALSGLLGAMLGVLGRTVRVKVGERVEAPGRPASEMAGPEEVCREVMRRWPNGPGCGVSYDVYVAVAHALWAACRGGADWDGLELFGRWARQHPKANAAEDARKWASVREPRIGVEWLIEAVPGPGEEAGKRKRRPGRGVPETREGLVVTSGVRAGWLSQVVTWRLKEAKSHG